MGPSKLTLSLIKNIYIFVIFLFKKVVFTRVFFQINIILITIYQRKKYFNDVLSKETNTSLWPVMDSRHKNILYPILVQVINISHVRRKSIDETLAHVMKYKNLFQRQSNRLTFSNCLKCGTITAAKASPLSSLEPSVNIPVWFPYYSFTSQYFILKTTGSICFTQ